MLAVSAPIQRVGIPEYWIVDLDARAVERWRPQDDRAELLNERLIWHPAGVAGPLELDLPALAGRTGSLGVNPGDEWDSP